MTVCQHGVRQQAGKRTIKFGKALHAWLRWSSHHPQQSVPFTESVKRSCQILCELGKRQIAKFRQLSQAATVCRSISRMARRSRKFLQMVIAYFGISAKSSSTSGLMCALLAAWHNPALQDLQCAFPLEQGFPECGGRGCRANADCETACRTCPHHIDKSHTPYTWDAPAGLLANRAAGMPFKSTVQCIACTVLSSFMHCDPLSPQKGRTTNHFVASWNVCQLCQPRISQACNCQISFG